MNLTRTSACFGFPMLTVRYHLSLRFVACLLVCCLLLPLRVHADTYRLESPLVRVGLMRFASVSALTLSAEPGAHLFGPEGEERAAGIGPWTITAQGMEASVTDVGGHRLGTLRAGEVWRLQSDNEQTILGIGTPGRAPRHYRGCLEIRCLAGRLHAVNEVALETYLRGVVASEMGADSPLEALKAQAVASRTYALRCLGKWGAEGYDLRDTTDSQVYGGVEAEYPLSDRAVHETAGLILTVGGQPIWATFCADCGGVTAPGATPDDCPRSVEDTDAHASVRSSPNHTWTLRYTPDQLAARLRSDPHLRDLGTLAAVEITQTDVSGRARRLRLVWQASVPSLPSFLPPDMSPLTQPFPPPDDPNAKMRPPGPPILGGEAQADTLLVPPKVGGVRGRVSKVGGAGRRSAGEQASKIGRQQDELSGPQATSSTTREIGGNALRLLLGVNVLRSTLFTVHCDSSGNFVFEGRGWGHGRGLCQTGAIALAGGPMANDFQTILRRYYAGAALTRLHYTDEENADEAQNTQRQLTRQDDGLEAKHGR